MALVPRRLCCQCVDIHEVGLAGSITPILDSLTKQRAQQHSYFAALPAYKAYMQLV
jgi:hypothetical protein